MVDTYRRNKGYLQAIAQRKYQRREFEPEGLVVRLGDIDNSAPAVVAAA